MMILDNNPSVKVEFHDVQDSAVSTINLLSVSFHAQEDHRTGRKPGGFLCKPPMELQVR